MKNTIIGLLSSISVGLSLSYIILISIMIYNIQINEIMVFSGSNLFIYLLNWLFEFFSSFKNLIDRLFFAFLGLVILWIITFYPILFLEEFLEKNEGK